MPFCVVLYLQTASEKLPYPALPFHIAQRNPRLAHLRTEVGEEERKKCQNERYKLMIACLGEVAEYIKSLGYPAQPFNPKHRWDQPKPDMWTILGDSLPPGSGILPVGLLSPQRPVDSDWAQEFKPVITSVVREYGCKITSDRMMHAGVISKFQLEEIKRVVKLFCIFENVIDDLEFKSELATPDKLPRVESVRRNRVLRDMEDNEVMAAINGAEDIFGLRMLVVPYLVVHGLPQAATYKLQLVYHKSRTEILFNSHPTTTCADKIVRFMELMVKFVQYALDHDDETIEDCQPSLDVFFDEIICDAKLADCYDPRRSRDVNPVGVLSRLSSPASSLDGSHSDIPSP